MVDVDEFERNRPLAQLGWRARRHSDVVGAHQFNATVVDQGNPQQSDTKI